MLADTMGSAPPLADGDATIERLRQLLLVFLVSFLSLGASGVPSLVVPEPCALDEAAGADEGICPPTCVVCGCCAQAAVPMPVTVVSTYHAPVAAHTQRHPLLPDYDPRKILHVPKAFLA